MFNFFPFLKIFRKRRNRRQRQKRRHCINRRQSNNNRQRQKRRQSINRRKRRYLLHSFDAVMQASQDVSCEMHSKRSLCYV